jgi:hypothetical protein
MMERLKVGNAHLEEIDMLQVRCWDVDCVFFVCAAD